MTTSLEILSNGEISVEGRLVAASNATLFTTITLGERTCNAIYKPFSGERPLWDFPDGTLGLRERAAYVLSELGDFNLVPTTILRDGPFGRGAVQLWIDVDDSIDMALYYRQRSPALRSAALFDAVINNTDRKIGHLLPTLEGRLFLCDHGVTFHEEYKLRTVLWQWAGEDLSSEEMAQLQALYSTISETTTELDELLSHQEIEALKERIQDLLNQARFPNPSEDWPAIPWPPF